MKYVEFDQSRPMDLVLLGRVAIDFNPAYNDQVKEEFKPLKKVHMFEKFVGGSPANIAVGVTRHGMKAGFLGKVSDDQFGEYVVDYFDEQGGCGFDYAYQYPGMNKVLQAAGRVIRTAEDRGVILLLDDRFLRQELQELFPREWTEYGLVTRETAGGWLKHFWEKR